MLGSLSTLSFYYHLSSLLFVTSISLNKYHTSLMAITICSALSQSFLSIVIPVSVLLICSCIIIFFRLFHFLLNLHFSLFFFFISSFYFHSFFISIFLVLVLVLRRRLLIHFNTYTILSNSIPPWNSCPSCCLRLLNTLLYMTILLILYLPVFANLHLSCYLHHLLNTLFNTTSFSPFTFLPSLTFTC